jgi:hypothetical protein
MDYYLSITHAFGDMLIDYFKVSNYSLFYNVEDDNDDYIGEYDIPLMII